MNSARTTITCLLFCISTYITAQTIPSDYDEYLQMRDSLMQLDSLRYFDHGEVLTEDEKLLERKLLKLQQTMNRDYQEQHFFPPARNFYLSKAHIEQTKLFRILRMMPKGGALHLHSSASGDPDWIIDRAITTPEMHVYWQAPTEEYTKGQLRAFRPGEAPEGFRPVERVMQEDPEFRNELRALLTFEHAMDRDSTDIWKEFQSVFQRISGFVYYRPVFTAYLTHGLELLAEDNIQHAELRLPFRNDLYDLDGARGTGTIEEYVGFFQQILDNVRQTDPEFTVKIIHAELRFKDAQTIWRDIIRTHQFRKQYPEWLKGYDLVAEEDNGHPTLVHAETFLRLDSMEKATGVQLPLYLHDGESNWASVANLYDAILLGTQRIGHGFNLFRFPSLIELVKERNICLEINPLSNQILGYIRDLRNHPGSTYLRRGVACVISSDDPMIFDYHGLSYDYWSIFLAWELDLGGLKQLSRNNLLYATLNEEEKSHALKIWEQRWQKFVHDALNSDHLK